MFNPGSLVRILDTPAIRESNLSCLIGQAHVVTQQIGPNVCQIYVQDLYLNLFPGEVELVYEI